MSFKNLTLIYIPKTSQYMIERDHHHHAYLILQRVQDLIMPLICMTCDELETFDNDCLNYLKHYDVP